MKTKIYAVLCFTILIVFLLAGYGYQQYKKEEAYLQAVEYVKVEKYEEAMTMLSKANKKELDKSDFRHSFNYDSNAVEYYKNTAVLYAYCTAKTSYEKNSSIGFVNSYMDFVPENYNGELHDTILAFKTKVYKEYMDYLEAERIREQQEEEDRIKTSVPFVGMSESRINDTILGTNYEIVHNSEFEKGERIQANVYRFKRGNAIIFVARCLKGRVDSVSDYRDDPWVIATQSGTKKSTSENDDPYDVNEYYGPEDFYEDNYDDFWDYEDAEDYYNEHHE